ncbi:hypothetical protein XELAEV_18001633mg [Xenopus laevis]|nr:hypothetical protein XELAEV_18001633mg [Xenopus laevis]
MRLSITFILLLVLTVTCSNALRCHHEAFGLRKPTACPESQSNCLSYEFNKVVPYMRMFKTLKDPVTDVCSLKVAFKGCATDSMCDQAKNKTEGEGPFRCCQTDFCNE